MVITVIMKILIGIQSEVFEIRNNVLSLLLLLHSNKSFII